MQSSTNEINQLPFGLSLSKALFSASLMKWYDINHEPYEGTKRNYFMPTSEI
jgi:hypothetical protein